MAKSLADKIIDAVCAVILIAVFLFPLFFARTTDRQMAHSHAPVTAQAALEP